MRQPQKKKAWRRWEGLALGLLALLCAGLLLLRYTHTGGTEPELPAPAATREPARESPAAVTDSPAAESPKPEETAAPEASAEPTAAAASPTPLPAPTEAVPIPGRAYNAKTYKLVSDMVYTYRVLQEEGAGDVSRLLEQLKAEDPELGAAWEGIMSYWDYVNTGLEIQVGAVPEGLPEDDSLGIVVLGFELMYDGSMTPELIGRCELALSCAQRYPNAWLVLTGGGTALQNKQATEAGVMAEWFLERGVEEKRLILEDRSLTSADNAEYSCAILGGGYSQIKNLMIVTSDYHIQMGCLLFEESAWLYGWEYGEKPFTVVANTALATPGRDDYKGTKKQAQYLWALANPHY